MARNRYYQGPPSDHFDGARFFNPGQPSTDRSFKDLLRWRREGIRADWSGVALPSRTVRPEARVAGLAVTMVGHGSVLLQIAGLNLLLDPVWSERVSPVPFLGPQRYDPPGILFTDLPPIDAVLLSHNHYDHMDTATLGRLRDAFAPRMITPLGNEAVLAWAAPGCRVETGDWGAQVMLSDNVRVRLHPAYHWSARRAMDRRMALWCGFVVQSTAGSAYLSADTGYGDGAPFRLVREQFGPPDVAVLPIGAYEPRWFMKDQHANPDDAVRMLLDCGARQGLGVHWGTFQLTDEARDAPVEALNAACRAHGVEAFLPLRPGDVWTAAPP